MRRIGVTGLLCCAMVACLFWVYPARGASFTNNAYIQITDSSAALSVGSDNRFTVSFWVKITLASDAALPSTMALVVNRKDGDENSIYPYLFRFNADSDAVEFMAKGDGGSYSRTLIQNPYMDRWYHVAMVRDGSVYTPYVDGRALLSETRSIGNTITSNGVSIAGWNGAKYFSGEIQEVAIYQNVLLPGQIKSYMYQDQFGYGVKGYYRLGYTTNAADRFKNMAASAPFGTDGVKGGSGDVGFEETDQQGEQSLYDSRKNGGHDAVAPLSGSFTWEQTVLARPTPGVAFAFEYGYSSANAFSGGRLGDFDPFGAPPLGAGWRHSFESMLAPRSPSGEQSLIMWDGSVETWNLTGGVWRTQHREYRGELVQVSDGSGDYEWTTPDRQVYRFRDPGLGDMDPDVLMAGRLMEIHDFNAATNRIRVQYRRYPNGTTDGTITQVVDSAGGAYTFKYAGSRLTNVAFRSWSVNFSYDTSNRLVNVSRSTPAGYTSVNTRWGFDYSSPNGLLGRIVDPRTNDTIRVFYDKYGRKTNEVDALNRSRATEYGVPTKRQIRNTDPAGFKWTETFDRKGRLVAQQDPLGNVTRHEYNDFGNVVATTEPKGNRTAYAYDTRANKTAETNALGGVSRWAYHPFFNKPVQAIDPLNWSIFYDYDSAGNLTRQYDAIGTMVTYTYASNGLVLTSTDGNGNLSRVAYTPDGFVSSTTDPATNNTSYGRNELGWPLSVTNALGQVTTSSYDVNGRVVRTVDPMSRVFMSTYDPNGNLTSQADAKGQLTLHFYDAEDQKTQTIDRALAVWRTTYTPLGQVASQIDPLSNTNRFAYDAANRLTNAMDAVGNSESYEYDANDNRVATIDKLGRRWPTTFDVLDRPITKSDPLGETTETTYDVAGRIRTITSPNGYPSTHEYDGRGRLVRWVDAENYVWLYDYDGNANITNVTDALSGHYVMSYGPRNERTLERNQDTNEWRYAYDELMRLKQQQDPNGLVRSATYDAGGRPVEINYSSGRIDTFSYDENNNPEVGTRTGSGPATTTQLAFDSMDRVTDYKDHFGNRVKYRYDQRGAVTNIVYPGNFVLQQTFDAVGRLTGQTDWAGRQMAYTYDKASRLITRTYPNGFVQTNTFDAAGRITELSYLQSANNPLIAMSYAYDKNGNKTRAEEKGTLDWNTPSRIDETAKYTPANKLVDRLNAANTNRSFVYHYDPSGNMTNAASREQGYTLVYDEDNRVTAIHWDSFPLTDKDIINRYDILGRRVSRKVDGVETRYVLNVVGDMERVLCDQNAAGQVTAYYVHGPDLCYAVDAAGNTVNYHADAMGNIIALTDSNKSLVAQYAYTPYGRVLGATNSLTACSTLVTANPYLFVGVQGVMQELAAGDLYFMRARYYSAEAGVFLSTDPVKHIGPGWKPTAYVYGFNNPLRYRDPEGKWALADDVAAMAVGAIGGAVGQFLSDVVTVAGGGKWSGWESYAGAALGGAAAAETLLYTANPWAAGAVGGAVGNATEQGFSIMTGKQKDGFDVGELAMETGLGAVTGKLGDKVGINSGRGNSEAVAKQLVHKSIEGQINPLNISGKTAGKITTGIVGSGSMDTFLSMATKTVGAIAKATAVNAIQSIKVSSATISKGATSIIKTAVQKTQQVVSQVKQVATQVTQKVQTVTSTIKSTVKSVVSSVKSKIASIFSPSKSTGKKK